MIQNMWYVSYAFSGGALYAAQQEVVVLRTIEADTKASDVFYQRAAIDPEVIEIVLGQYERWVPVGLEMADRASGSSR